MFSVQYMHKVAYADVYTCMFVVKSPPSSFTHMLKLYLCSDVKHNLERMMCGFITLSTTIKTFSNPNNVHCPDAMAKAVTQVSLILMGLGDEAKL